MAPRTRKNTEYKNEQDRYTTQYYEPINNKTEDLKQRQKYIIEGIKSTAKNPSVIASSIW